MCVISGDSPALLFSAAGFSSWRCLPAAMFGAKTAILCLMVKNRNQLCPNVSVQRRRRLRGVIKEPVFPNSALRHSMPGMVL